jgi:hypothetical protein
MKKSFSYREENNSKLSENGKLIPKTFTTYYTIMGPMAKRDENGSFKINNRSMKEQSWMRTKSKSFEDYKKQWI